MTVTLDELVSMGILNEGTVLIWRRNREGSVHRAVVYGRGIQTADGLVHKSPSGAARHLNGNKPIDGWKCWRVEKTNKSIDELRIR